MIKNLWISFLNLHILFFLIAGDEGDGGKKPAEPEKAVADKPAEKAAAADSGFPPTFTEKPRIVPNETGTLVTMKFKVIIFVSI